MTTFPHVLSNGDVITNIDEAVSLYNELVGKVEANEEIYFELLTELTEIINEFYDILRRRDKIYSYINSCRNGTMEKQEVLVLIIAHCKIANLSDVELNWYLETIDANPSDEDVQKILNLFKD